uniref:NADH-ubiquinone oxidoreductase chain 6 n=1 Tax=Plethodon shenandoah TaxID=141978 RepID=A0A4Y5P4A2_9SALA|nr:NADH dehydrogenase subunit 6 [Plethodon shenandoah]QCW58041.1 NADH dehydrogenase subunit 6 [Plethodon shenandoah]QCW58054.1 NADH dehydrogenase subunit 6 [Plethodon shenandoah]QCW58080.1 NADH dehydrogenase subunit 6 [Plethodon shenandoah]QCW58093.1 NADH dehydrogenase subunit 6 [Plethodon shenandoah]
MAYVSFLALVGLVVGFIVMASNSSPYFAALGLVVGAVFGCWILINVGISFLSLVLVLIYLGGMLVVFAYSASLAAEPYPEVRISGLMLMYIIMMMLVMSFIFILVCDVNIFEGLFSGVEGGWGMVGQDTSGVSLMYNLGKVMLIISGWALLLTLFVVLGVTWGVYCGSLRAV